MRRIDERLSELGYLLRRPSPCGGLLEKICRDRGDWFVVDQWAGGAPIVLVHSEAAFLVLLSAATTTRIISARFFLTGRGWLGSPRTLSERCVHLGTPGVHGFGSACELGALEISQLSAEFFDGSLQLYDGLVLKRML